MPFGSENNKKVLPSSNPIKSLTMTPLCDSPIFCQQKLKILPEIQVSVAFTALFLFHPIGFPIPTSIRPSEAPAPRCSQGETSQGCTHGHRRDDVGLQVAYIVVITTHCCIEKTRGAATSPEIDHPHFFSGVQAEHFPEVRWFGNSPTTPGVLQHVFCSSNCFG